MRRTFLIWLSAVICATFVITGVLVYSQFSYSAQERAEQMMSTRLNDMLDLLEHADSSISYLNRANDASALDRTRALAEIIKLNPGILCQQEELQGICNRLGAEQISICTEEGIVEAAVPAALVGANLSTSEDLQLLATTGDTDSYETYSTVAPGESEHRGAMQFAGVRRLDKPGIVRLGFRTRFEQASREESSLDNPAMKLRLGEQGRVIVIRRGKRVSHGGPNVVQEALMALAVNKVQEIKIDDQDYFAYAVDGSGYRLVGVLPTSEIYTSSLKAAQTILLSNLLLFAIMFMVVSYLLQRIVIRGMSRVNAALRDITEGDLERRVNVVDSPEFTRLSNGINFMVESLRSVGEERQQSTRRELELARTLQSTILPNKFPAFPDINRFDLYAACFQADDVGGDFFDYNMPDADHLHFLVADVDASGIPAALYMMRAMTIIRSIARAADAPCQIVTAANRELCDDNQAGIHMALFYGNLNIRTGELEYVNAGRLSALIQRNGDEYTPMPAEPDPALGDTPDAEFHTIHLQLTPQDRLFLFTEGVLTVQNTSNELFNEKRLRKALSADAASVTDVLHLVRSSLRQFVEGRKLKKDISMLCLEYRGELGNKVVLNFAAGEPQDALDLISQQMEEVLAAPLDIADVQESIRTVCATLPAETTLRLEFGCTESEAEATLAYAPPALDPTADIATPLPVDRVAYEYIDNKENRLSLCKTLM